MIIVNALYTVARLGNVVGGDPVLYVNAEISILKQVAIEMLKADSPVFFGCDVGRASEAKVLGILDPALYNFESAFSTKLGLTKSQRLQTGDSAMTHAMVLNAVHLDEAGKSVRWRIENSWGNEIGTKVSWSPHLLLRSLMKPDGLGIHGHVRSMVR